MKSYLLAACMLCVGMLSCGSAETKSTGLIIVNDTFTDGSRDKTGALDADWRNAQTVRSITVVTQEVENVIAPEYWLKMTPGEGHYPTMAGIFDKRPGNPNGTGEGAVLGAKDGDQLELSMDFRFEEADTRNKEIRIGLFNNSGTITDSDKQWGAFTDDVGYWVSIPQSGGPADIWKKTGGSGTIVGGSDKVLLRAMSGPKAPNLSTNRHSIALTLKRDPAGIIITATLDGTVLQTGIDTPNSDAQRDPPGLYTAFQEIGVGMGEPLVNPVYITKVMVTALGAGAKLPKKVTATAAAPPGTAEPSRKGMLFGIAAIAGALLLLIIAISITWTVAKRSNK